MTKPKSIIVARLTQKERINLAYQRGIRDGRMEQQADDKDTIKSQQLSLEIKQTNMKALNAMATAVEAMAHFVAEIRL